MSTIIAKLKPGDLLDGRYRIIDLIGMGGMGLIYRASEEGLIRRQVAVKVLRSDDASSRRFLQEAQAIASLNHPNILQLIAVGRTDAGAYFIVTELLTGKTLGEEFNSKKKSGDVFSWKELSPLVLQICLALQAVHERKIIHRDIKPSNCFCVPMPNGDRHIKLLDFGLAKVCPGPDFDGGFPSTASNVILGTPHFIAPEIVMGENREVDGRADIFSLGVLLYQLLTGSLPFEGEATVKVLFKVAYEVPPSLRQRAPHRNIPPVVDALVMRAMAIRREDRFDSVAKLATAIQGVSIEIDSVSSETTSTGATVGGGTISVPQSAPQSAPALRRTTKAVLAAAAALLVTLLLVLLH